MKLSDRYLSSKIDHIKGIWMGIPFENYTLVINFLSGKKKSSIIRKTFKHEFATEREAKDMEGKALCIIKDYLKKGFIDYGELTQTRIIELK